MINMCELLYIGESTYLLYLVIYIYNRVYILLEIYFSKYKVT